MDIPQLKLLAGRTRALLQQSSSNIGHSQALDLVAALPGLRNWPEVLAFPHRVAACQLDTTSVARLAFRLKKQFSMDFSPRELFVTLAPEPLDASQVPLQVWPGGPTAGVYVTTSAGAIRELLARYEEATDGGLVYAERAGSGWEGSIDLGEHGLWSPGIDRLPSGTLLVIGPIELDQQSWGDAADRLEMACLHALNSNHRVAVLFKTPTPDVLHEDVALLVQSAMAAREFSDADTALMGLVAENGELQRCRPFSKAYPRPVLKGTRFEPEAFPESTRDALVQELGMRKSGVVLFGASEHVEHTASEQVAAALALTEHVGPAARIMSRHRSTPAKDWLVSDAIKALPFLPSVESAYAQGYRRMVIEPSYSRAELLWSYDDVLFIAGTYGHTVPGIMWRLLSGPGPEDAQMMKRVVAVLGLFQVTSKRGKFVASDLFVRGTLQGPSSAEFGEREAFLKANRAVRWEEELALLIDTGAVTVSAVKKAGRHPEVAEFLSERRTFKKAS